jgi:hypothetical protein
MPHLLPVNSFDRLRLLMLASRIRHEVDAEMAVAVERIANGDDGAHAQLHDRAHVIVRPDLADRIRRIVRAD